MQADTVVLRLCCLAFFAIGSGMMDTSRDSQQFCDKESCTETMFEYKNDEKLMIFRNEEGEFLRIQTVGIPDSAGKPDKCDTKHTKDQWCLNWTQYANLKVERLYIDTSVCFRVIWSPLSNDFVPYDCMSMEDAHWYGGAELHDQRWPLRDCDIPMQPFVSSDLVGNIKSFGNVLEPLWINTKGVGFTVDDKTPLFVSIDAGGTKELCLKADYSEQYFPLAAKRFLNYTVCKSKNTRDIYHLLHSLVLEPPLGVPDLRMISKPIMSTWVRYKLNITEDKVLKFADEIVQHGFPHSQLEIDDMYSTQYGDFDFDPVKFPDVHGMIKKLKENNFRITTWITPFANLPSRAFQEGLINNYWVMDKGRNVPALVKWWQGIAGTLDVTNPKAAGWFVTRLRNMKDRYGIDSFKFDAGEMTYFPTSYQPHSNVNNPGFQTQKYVDIAHQLGSMVEVRCGYKSQKYPIFVRMADKESKWGHDNGLKTLIPVVLTLGILGYPYILPDMIGGNSYNKESFFDCTPPDRELYIRWMQVTAYLPAMQFSVMPWDYDQEVIDIALELVKIHEEIVTPLLIEAAKETMKNGSPLIRPLWWIEPEDEVAQTNDSEFLVGNDLLVAPVLNEGARTRDVYLPQGTWLDNLNKEIIVGGRWLKERKVEIHEILTFSRQYDS